MAHHLESRTDRVAWVALAALVVFTLASVAGYGVYGLHPQLLPDDEWARRVFAASFEFFARGHVILAAIVLGVVLVRALKGAWVAAFAAVAVVSFVAEHVGTGYGIPFGGYGYTGLLGLKIGGRVPALIPVSWFLMALPSWLMARRAIRGDGGAWKRVAIGAMWLVLWDLSLDPAMSYLTPYWIWEETGPYYGMPLLNLVGWYTTGLVIMGVLEGFFSGIEWEAVDFRWVVAYYGVMVLLPLGMLAAATEWLAVVVAIVATALGAALTFGLPKLGETASSAAPVTVGVEA